MRDPDGRSRGFAFLTFEDAESVNAVLARDHVLDGKSVRRLLRFHPPDVDSCFVPQIDPKRAIPREEHLRNTRYFVGGLAPTTTAESMRDFFSAFGKVVDATVMVDRESGRSKGFGFVTFEDATNSEQFVGKLGLVLDDKQASAFVSGVHTPTYRIMLHHRSKLKLPSPGVNAIRPGMWVGVVSHTSTIKTRGRLRHQSFRSTPSKLATQLRLCSTNG